MREPVALLGATTAQNEDLRAALNAGLLTPADARIQETADHGNVYFQATGHARLASWLALPAMFGAYDDIRVLADLDDDAQYLLRQRMRDENSAVADLIARAFTRFGLGLGSLMRGAYALIVWDNRRNQLSLALDPMGTKTLYYTQRSPDGFAVASQARTLRHMPGVWRPDPRATLMWCLNEYDSRFSMWQGIIGLRPGEWQTLAPHGVVQQRRFPIPHGPNRTFEVSEWWQTLETVVREKAPAPAATHSMLSGGLDSTCVAATYAAATGTAPTCHAFAFERLQDCAEQNWSKRSAAQIGTPLIMYTAEDYPVFHRLSEGDKPENPFQSGTLLESAVLQRVRAESGIFLMTGHGGDSLFTNPATALLSSKPWARPSGATQSSAAKAKRLWQVWLAHWQPNNLQRYRARRRGTWRQQPAWFQPEALQAADPWSWLDQMPLRSHLDPLTFALHTRLTRDAAGVRRAIHWYNRAGLKQGVKVVHPLFDERLADWVLHISRKQWMAAREPKGLMRGLLADRFGLDVAQRLEKPTLTAYYHASLVREQAFLAEQSRIWSAQGIPWFDATRFVETVANYCNGQPPYPPADFLAAAWYLVWYHRDFYSN